MFERRQRLRVDRAKILRKRRQRRGADHAEQERDQNRAGWHRVTLGTCETSMEGLQRPDNNGLILNFVCSRRNGRGHLLTIETRHPLRMRRLWPGVAWLRQAAACASGRAVR